MGRIGHHVKANAIAYAALFFALGGTAVASHEAILSSDIVDNEIRSVDLRDAQVMGIDVRDNNLTGADIAEDTLVGFPSGRTAYRTIGVTPGSAGTMSVPGAADITYTCPADHLNTDGTIAFRNTNSKGIELFTDTGAEDPRYDRVPPAASRSQTANRDGDRFVYSYEGTGAGQRPFWGTISVDTVHRPDTGYGEYCRASMQAFLSL
jgi:hypothetical protein